MGVYPPQQKKNKKNSKLFAPAVETIICFHRRESFFHRSKRKKEKKKRYCCRLLPYNLTLTPDAGFLQLPLALSIRWLSPLGKYTSISAHISLSAEGLMNLGNNTSEELENKPNGKQDTNKGNQAQEGLPFEL